MFGLQLCRFKPLTFFFFWFFALSIHSFVWSQFHVLRKSKSWLECLLSNVIVIHSAIWLSLDLLWVSGPYDVDAETGRLQAKVWGSWPKGRGCWKIKECLFWQFSKFNNCVFLFEVDNDRNACESSQNLCKKKNPHFFVVCLECYGTGKLALFELVNLIFEWDICWKLYTCLKMRNFIGNNLMYCVF